MATSSLIPRRIRGLWDDYRLEVTTLILVLIAIVLFVIGAFVESQWQGRLNAAASGVLGGGVFTALTKIAQIGGIFREEIREVMFSDEMLDVRSDKGDIVVRAMQSLHGHRFPGIREKLTKESLNIVWPRETRFYLKDVTRSVVCKLVDAGESMVSISHSMDGQLITASDEEQVVRKHRYEYVPNAADPDQMQALLLAKRHAYWPVDSANPEQDKFYDEVLEPEVLANGNMEVTFVATLDGGSAYRVQGESEQLQRLKIDNMIGFLSNTYIDTLKVRLDFDANDLNMQFSEVGTKFRDDGSRKGRIAKLNDGLLFSDMGFFVTIQVVN